MEYLEVLKDYLPLIMTGIAVDLIGAYIAKHKGTKASSVLGLIKSIIGFVFKKK